MNKKPTAVMRQCMEYMQSHGNEIFRHPGGFWAEPNWTRGEINFSTQTVYGLFYRLLIEFTEHRENRGGKFAIRARLISQPSPKSVSVKTNKDQKTAASD